MAANWNSASELRNEYYRTWQIDDLCLTAPGGATIWCAVRAGSCGNTISDLLANPGGRKAPAGFTNSRDLLILHLNQRTCSPAAALGHGLLVGSEVEGEEEEKVGRDDADTGDRSKFLASTLAQVGKLGEVSAGKVGVRGEVDET